MSEHKRIRASLLAVIGLALVALTAVVLISLRNPTPKRVSAADEVASAGGRQAHALARLPARPAAATAPLPTIQPSNTGAQPMPAPPPSGRLEAPPVTPLQIERERDPVKKAWLIKIHRLSTARVRLSMVRRRQGLLDSSIGDAKRQGTWSAVKIQRAENQLSEVKGAVTKAEERLESIRQEVGGDIDKDLP